MAVFRIEKTRDYTVMSNHHLRNTELSLKAKGLLSLMLSLPENWDYTTKGLARICKDGVDSISSGTMPNKYAMLKKQRRILLPQPKVPPSIRRRRRRKPWYSSKGVVRWSC